MPLGANAHASLILLTYLVWFRLESEISVCRNLYTWVFWTTVGGIGGDWVQITVGLEFF